MRLKRHILALVILILLLGVARIYLVSQVDYPAYDAFYGMRQVESIAKTGFPLIFDELSYQGRNSFSNILSYYLMAAFDVFLPTSVVFQHASTLLFMLVLLVTYLLSRELFLGKWLALLTTFLVGSSSVIFLSGANTLIPSSFFMLFLLLTFYGFLSNNSMLFLISSISMILTSSLSLVVLLGFLFYLLIVNLEQLKLDKKDFELLLFSLLFGIWYHLLLYKTLLFEFGPKAIWAGIPLDIQSQLFQSLDAPILVAVVGSIPLLLGVYGAYSSLFEHRNRKLIFIVALTLAFSLLTWLSFIPLLTGLLFTSLSLLLLSGYGALRIKSFFSKTVVGWLQPLLVSLLVALTLFGFGSIFYANPLFDLAPSEDELRTMNYLKENTPIETTILGSVSDGHLISGVAHRKNVFDNKFAFAPQAQQRYDDVRNMYLSVSQIGVLDQLQSYGVDYIYISPQVREFYPVNNYLFSNSECFSLYYQTKTTEVYEIKCFNTNLG